MVATAPLFLLQRWRLSRTLNFYFCSCSLSSLTKLHVVQLSVPLSWNWRAPRLSQSKVRSSQTAIHRACHNVCFYHRDLIQSLSVMFSITIKKKIHILWQKKNFTVKSQLAGNQNIFFTHLLNKAEIFQSLLHQGSFRIGKFPS